MGSIDVLPALNTGKALWYSRVMGNTVLETTQIVTMDQLSGSVLTSVLVTSADVISEHMEVTTMLHKGVQRQCGGDEELGGCKRSLC